MSILVLPLQAYVAYSTSDSVINKPDTLNTIHVNNLKIDSTYTAMEKPIPHYHTVLFLSAEDLTFYSTIGLLQALEELNLSPDIIVAESKTALLGVAWALGYSAQEMRIQFVQNPANSLFILDTHLGNEEKNNLVSPLKISFNNISPLPNHFNFEIATQKKPEFLNLSWTIALLTYNTPFGPIDKMENTPYPLALQMLPTKDSVIELVQNGSLQNLLKACVAPSNLTLTRSDLSHFQPGEWVTGHNPKPNKWPFSFDHILMLKPSGHEPPANLDQHRSNTVDSVFFNWQKNLANMESSLYRNKIFEIIFTPPASDSVNLWIEAGYQATLQNRDPLRTTLNAKNNAANIVMATLQKNKISAKSSLVSSLKNAGLLGKPILGDILNSNYTQNDSNGYSAIRALTNSDFYSQLDVEWFKSSQDPQPTLQFYASEKPKILFEGGAEASMQGYPELYGQLSWAEPFYIPFKLEGAAITGLRETGLGWQMGVYPIFPMKLALTFSQLQRDMEYKIPPDKIIEMGGRGYFLRQNRQRFALAYFPFPATWLKFALAKNFYLSGYDMENGKLGFSTMDISKEIHIPIPNILSSKKNNGELMLHHENRFPKNESGEVQDSVQWVEALLSLAFGPVQLKTQYYWSDFIFNNRTLFFDPQIYYDPFLAGEIQALDLQENYFLYSLRANHFLNPKMTYTDAIYNFEYAVSVGRYYILGDRFSQEIKSTVQDYGEALLRYQTPFGPIQIGLGSLGLRRATFFSLKIGVHGSLLNLLDHSSL